MPLSPIQLNDIKRKLKEQGMSEDKISISVRKVQEQYEEKYGSQPIETGGYSAPQTTQRTQNQPVSSVSQPRSMQSQAPRQQNMGSQPQQTDRDTAVGNFFQSLFSYAPDVGQTITGLASIPVTAMMGPTAGKAARTGIGALGRVGGEVLNQAGSGLVDDLENWNNPNYIPSLMDKNRASQNLKDLRNEAVIGLGSEAVGEFLIGPAFEKYASPILGGLFKRGTGAVNKALAPFKNQVNKEVVGLAAEKGVDLPVSAKTSSNFVKQIEAWSQRSFFGEKTTQKIISAKESVEGLAKTMTDDLAKPLDKKSVGQIVKEGFAKFEESFTKTKTELYNQVPKAVYKAEAVTTETTKVLDTITQRRGQSLAPNQAGFYKNISTQINEATTNKQQLDFFESLGQNLKKQGLTFENLKQTRTDLLNKLKNFNDPVATGNKADLKALVAALSDDIEQTVKRLDPDAYALFDQANTFYREGLEKVNSKIGQQIKNASPEKLLDTLLKPNSETDIALVKDVLDEKAVNELKENFVTKLYNDAINNRTQLLDINKMRTQIKKYGEASIKELIGEEGFARLNQTMADLADIETLNKAINRGVKPAEGSQTAFLMNTILSIGTYAFNPKLLAGKLGIEYGISKLVTTEAGQRWLTEGLGELAEKSGASLNQPIEEIVKRITALYTSQLSSGGNVITGTNAQQDTSQQLPATDNMSDDQGYTNNNQIPQTAPPSNLDGSIAQNQPKVPIPFNGMSKYELVQLAVAQGFSGSQLDEIRNTYDTIMQDYREAVGGQFNSEEATTLFKLREQAVASNMDTSVIDQRLQSLGFSPGYGQSGANYDDLSNPEINTLTQTEGALTDVANLYEAISETNIVGPLSGRVRGANPYDLNAQSLQAEIDRVRQVVSKALEGGVLRKEDEEKYKKILPTLTDTKGLALNKLKQLEEKLSEDLARYREIQGLSTPTQQTPDPTQDQKKR